MAIFTLPLRCLAEAVPVLFDSGVLEIRGIKAVPEGCVTFDASVLGFGSDEELVMMVRNYEGEPRHYGFEPIPPPAPSDPNDPLSIRLRELLGS